MSDYIARTKTNLFRVTDEEKFKDIVSRMKGDDKIDLFIQGTSENPVFGFGCYGNIGGYEGDDGAFGGDDFNTMAEELQSILPEDEAIIITEIGHEKYCYVGGFVTVITKNAVHIKNMSDTAKEMASIMLGEPFVIKE